MDTSRYFLFHGSCKKCHHLHTGYQLQLAQNGESYTSYECEVCKYKMFGIGISSPRHSLASVNTANDDNSTTEGAATLDENVVRGATEPTSDAISGGYSHPSVDQLTITQQGTSRERSLPTSSETERPEGLPTSTETGTAPQSPDRVEAHTPVKFPSRIRNAALKVFGRVRRGVRKRMPRKVLTGHEPSAAVSGVSIPKEPTPPRDIDSTPEPMPKERVAESTGTSHREPVIIVDTDEVHPTSSQEQPTTESNEDTTLPQTSLARKERLRQLREEKTLERQRQSQDRCPCEDGCQCMNSLVHRPSSFGSMVPNPSINSQSRNSLFPRSSNNSASSLALRNLSPSGQVAFAGSQFNNQDHQYPGRILPQEDGDDRRMSRYSASTATTAVNSTSSRNQSRRANSMPLLTRRQLDQILTMFNVDRNRPEFQEAIQTLTVATASYSEGSSEHGFSRTNSADVASPRQSLHLESVGPHPRTYATSVQLSEVEEQAPEEHTTIAAAPNNLTPTEEGASSGRTVLPEAPESTALNGYESGADQSPEDFNENPH
jgi:hypothetical protein